MARFSRGGDGYLALADWCDGHIYPTETGPQEAQSGGHNDRIIAAGSARQARKRGVARAIPERLAAW